MCRFAAAPSLRRHRAVWQGSATPCSENVWRLATPPRPAPIMCRSRCAGRRLPSPRCPAASTPPASPPPALSSDPGGRRALEPLRESVGEKSLWLTRCARARARRRRVAPQPATTATAAKLNVLARDLAVLRLRPRARHAPALHPRPLLPPAPRLLTPIPAPSPQMATARPSEHSGSVSLWDARSGRRLWLAERTAGHQAPVTDVHVDAIAGLVASERAPPSHSSTRSRAVRGLHAIEHRARPAPLLSSTSQLGCPCRRARVD